MRILRHELLPLGFLLPSINGNSSAAPFRNRALVLVPGVCRCIGPPPLARVAKGASECRIVDLSTAAECAKIGPNAVILEDGTCCYRWGIRKGYDGPIEFAALIAYPNKQKGAAPGTQVGESRQSSYKLTTCSLSLLCSPLVPSAKRQTGQAPIQNHERERRRPRSLFLNLWASAAAAPSR
jgi:hypothetical protein